MFNVSHSPTCLVFFYILEDVCRTLNWFLNARYNLNLDYNFILMVARDLISGLNVVLCRVLTVGCCFLYLGLGLLMNPSSPFNLS